MRDQTLRPLAEVTRLWNERNPTQKMTAKAVCTLERRALVKLRLAISRAKR